MDNRGLIATVVALIATGGGIAYLASEKSKASTAQPSPAPSSCPYGILISGPAEGNVGEPVTITVSVEKDGVPVIGQSVTLKDITTGATSSTTTNSSGDAVFEVTINTPGKYYFKASSDVPC